MKKSIDYNNQAVRLDPTYGLAYSLLAASYGVQGNIGLASPREVYPKAKWAAEKAVEFDPVLADFHAPLGPVKLYYEWDWLGAEKEFKRMIEFNPDFSHGHSLYGNYLAAMGRLDEAIAAMERAQQIEPLSLLMNTHLGKAFYFARRHDDAIEQGKKTLEIDRHFLLTYLLLGKAYEQKGMYEQAIAEFQNGLSISEGDPAAVGSLGHVYAVSGNRAEAQKMLVELRERSKQRYVSPYNAALIHTGLGEKHQALMWLDKAREERDYRMIWLNVEPQFDSLRSDSRFTALVQRMGLGP